MLEKTITTAQGTVHYWIIKHWNSQAKCLVFTHGLTANHLMFDHQVSYFKQHYTIITWDLPLHGLSRPYTDFSYQHAAQNLNAILMQESIDSTVLIGQSLGGYVCQQFAVDFPEKVLAFIGVDTSPFGLFYYSLIDRFWLRQVEWLSHCYPYDFLIKSIARAATHTHEAYHNMITILKLYHKKELCKMMGIAYSSFLNENKNTSFKFPVLLMLGEYDKIGKVRKYNHAWALQTGYPLRIVPYAGHNSNVDNPEVFNTFLSDFLETL